MPLGSVTILPRASQPLLGSSVIITFVSVTLPPGKLLKSDSVKAYGRSFCCVTASRIGAALTIMSNSSLTEAVPSLAVTFTETVSAAVGVPEKVRVVSVNVSQVGERGVVRFLR